MKSLLTSDLTLVLVPSELRVRVKMLCSFASHGFESSRFLREISTMQLRTHTEPTIPELVPWICGGPRCHYGGQFMLSANHKCGQSGQIMVSRATRAHQAQRLVGLLGFEPRTKGFTLPKRF